MSDLLVVRDVPVVPAPAVAPPVGRLVVHRRPAPVRIFVTAGALARAWETVRPGGRFVERGGHLAGRYCVGGDGRRFIVITHALAADRAPSSAARIEIRPEDWIDAHRRLAERPGLRILGWYHSHPGSWVGMSSVDRATQRAQFNVDWQVGLVLAPCTGRFRFYQGPDAARAPWVALTCADDAGE